MSDGKKRTAEVAENDATVSEPKRVKGGPKCSSSGCIGYVAHNLYLGSELSRVPELLKEQGITHVLSIGLAADRRKYEKIAKLEGLGIACRFVAMGDDDRSGTRRAHEAREYYLRECAAFLEEGTKEANRTVVHCQRGRARSATVIAMHLVEAHKLTVMEALLLVLTARYDILPQDSSITALRTVEQERIKGTDESFMEANLPGEVCRAEYIRGSYAAFREMVSKNREFATTNKSKISHLKEEVGRPLSDGPESESLYAEHRFKEYLSWDEVQ